MKAKKYFINPVTILILIFLSTFVIFMGDVKLQYAAVAIGFIILLKLDFKLFIQFLIAYIVMGLFIFAIIHYNLFEMMQVSFFYPLVVFFYKVWPIITMARAIGTFNSSELMTAYRNIGLKDNLCLAIAIFFRFIPEFKHRMREIREAVKIRNLGPNILHPIRSFEVFIVPMIYRGLAISDIITASIITKGVEYQCEKTAYRDLSYKITDAIFLGLMLILAGVAIWQRLI